MLPPSLPQSSYQYDADRWEFDDPGRRFGRHTRIRLFGVDLDFQFTYDAGMRETDRSISLEGMYQRGMNFQPVFESFRPLLYAQTERIFANEGLPEPWPPLDKYYAAWKRKRYGERSILRRSDRLYASLLGGPEGIYVAHPHSLEYGSMVPYLDVHMEGAGSIPRRPPLALLPETFDTMSRAILNYVLTGRV